MAIIGNASFPFQGKNAYITSHDSDLVGVTFPSSEGVHLAIYITTDTARAFAHALGAAVQEIEGHKTRETLS